MSARQLLAWVGVAVLVAVALVVGARPEDPSGDEGRATAIAEGLRCPVCQGLSVADSDSETARSIRDDIDRRIDDGQTDAEIRQAYVDRYGEWILLRPRGEGLGALVWLLPIVAVGTTAVGLAVAGRRWRQKLWRRSASDDDRRLVARALATAPDGPGPSPDATGAGGEGSEGEVSRPAAGSVSGSDGGRG